MRVGSRCVAEQVEASGRSLDVTCAAAGSTRGDTGDERPPPAGAHPGCGAAPPGGPAQKVRGGLGGVYLSRSTWPGLIAAGLEMVCRLARYRAGHPPCTWCAAAMVNRVSPETTVYLPAAAEPDADRGVARAGRAVGAVLPAETCRMVGPSRPPAYAQVHAAQPCPARVFSATAICCSRVARSARGAYRRPP